MQKIKIPVMLLFLILLGACGEDDPEPKENKSSAADLMQLNVEYLGATYTTSISNTSVSLSNLLPDGAQKVVISVMDISPRATADKNVGDILQVNQNPIPIEITAENGTTKKSYSLTLETTEPLANQKLFGVNLAGAEFGYPIFPGTYNTHYTYPTAEGLDYYKSKGLNLIRLPFSWERIQPDLNGSLDATELSRVKGFLKAARSRNMAVILDLHNYCRYYLNGTDEIIGSPNLSIAHIKDLWTRLSSELKGRSEIWGYGIMNEPHDLLAGTPWFDIAQEIINGIRTSDPDTRILVGGDRWSSSQFWPSASDDLKNLNDPSNNLTFEAHCYFDNDSSGRYDQSYDEEGGDPNRGIERVAPFLNWLKTNNLNGFLGEYGVPADDPRWLIVLDNFLAHLEDNNVNGTYWAGGPWWGDYNLSIEPEGNVDKPQMEIVHKYPRID